MNEWIEGMPKDCGLYAIEFFGGMMTIVKFHSAPAQAEYATVLRHYRLPDIPRSLPLPRRFRAKMSAMDVVGAYVSNAGACRYIAYDKTGYLGHFVKDSFDSFEWIDREESKE